MHQTSILYRPLGRGAHVLDRLDDRQLADVGLEREGDLISHPSGGVVRRVAVSVGFERALCATFSAMRGAFARHGA
jgi:hypothetical protein